MNKQKKIIILAVAVLLLLTGCKDNNQEYRDMLNSLIEPMVKVGCIEITIAAG